VTWSRARIAATLTVITGLTVVATATSVSLYAFHHSKEPSRPPAPAHSFRHTLAAHPLATGRTFYLGVFERGVTASYRPVQEFAAATGSKPRIVLCYTAWNGPFEKGFAERAARNGAIPFVQMLPRGVSMASIAAGGSDSYLREYARQVRSYGLPVILSFAPEMNGWWYSWGWTHTKPAVWVAAWRRVVTVFRQQRATNVTWLWTVNKHGQLTGPVSDYWPGRQYVDWAGIDGYYFTPKSTFASMFGSTIQVIRHLDDNIPILVSETGAGQVAGQARSIPNLFAGIRRFHLIGFVWFDVDQNDGLYHQDWRLEGDSAALAVFHQEVQKLAGQQAK
jgi:hypothetical protein